MSDDVPGQPIADRPPVADVPVADVRVADVPVADGRPEEGRRRSRLFRRCVLVGLPMVPFLMVAFAAIGHVYSGLIELVIGGPVLYWWNVRTRRRNAAERVADRAAGRPQSWPATIALELRRPVMREFWTGRRYGRLEVGAGALTWWPRLHPTATVTIAPLIWPAATITSAYLEPPRWPLRASYLRFVTKTGQDVELWVSGRITLRESLQACGLPLADPPATPTVTQVPHRA